MGNRWKNQCQGVTSGITAAFTQFHYFLFFFKLNRKIYLTGSKLSGIFLQTFFRVLNISSVFMFLMQNRLLVLNIHIWALAANTVTHYSYAEGLKSKNPIFYR